ncbi:probable G-protein coupled receptor No18 [Ischnura elegans]|uniref:probable G-protein coupled receptor No18 n=1 Tax=Ischnura elegans TaxID=197161 RepID=UPI001ED8A3B1|nr:probable G-protein coupled receptor No18 [Ischnura elegans]
MEKEEIHNSTVPPYYDRGPAPVWEAAASGAPLVAITVLTVVGNILVILSIFKHKPLRIPPNYFIASLAATDITVALLVYPPSIVDSVEGMWLMGATFCRIWLALNILCCFASIFHLCAISMDRYWAITDPIRYAGKRTLSRILKTIAIIWLVSGFLSSFLLFGGQEDVINTYFVCILSSLNNRVISVFVTIFYLSLVAMSFVYARLFFSVRRRFRDATAKWGVVADAGSQGTSTAVTQVGKGEGKETETSINRTCASEEEVLKSKGPVNGEPRPEPDDDMRPKNTKWLGGGIGASDPRRGEFYSESAESSRVQGTSPQDASTNVSKAFIISEGPRETPCQPHQSLGKGTANSLLDEKQRVSQTKERRLAKTLGIILGAFIVCWLPFFILHFVAVFCHSCQPPYKIRKIFTWLGYVNSTINPIIYTVFNSEFRRAFKKILRIN